jgi:hypothetical protein
MQSFHERLRLFLLAHRPASTALQGVAHSVDGLIGVANGIGGNDVIGRRTRGRRRDCGTRVKCPWTKSLNMSHVVVVFTHFVHAYRPAH